MRLHGHHAVRREPASKGRSPRDPRFDATRLAFDENNWNTPRTVTVTAGRDDDSADDAATLVHSASGGGYGAARAVLAVRVADDDEPAILLAPSALQLAVGQSRG